MCDSEAEKILFILNKHEQACRRLKHFRNSFRVCINCFGHVIANTFCGNWGLKANRTKTYGKRKIIVLKID